MVVRRLRGLEVRRISGVVEVWWWRRGGGGERRGREIRKRPFLLVFCIWVESERP